MLFVMTLPQGYGTGSRACLRGLRRYAGRELSRRSGTFQEQTAKIYKTCRAASAAGSLTPKRRLRPRHPTDRVVGPVAVKADDAEFEAVPDAGETAVFDQGEIHGARLAVADHRRRGAVAPRDGVRLPGPISDFMHVGEAGDL